VPGTFTSAQDRTYYVSKIGKTYTNFSGIELPEMGFQAATFLKPLLRIGTSSVPVHIKTTSIPLFDIEATTALTTGTQRALQVVFTGTGAGFTGRSIYSELNINVAGGGYFNAIKANMLFGASGSTSGLASAINAEIQFPASGTTSGWYTALELEIVCLTSWTSTAPSTMIFGNTSGATKAAFDTNGYFLLIGAGPTAGAGKFLSLTEQTLKCSFGGSGSMSTRYMVFSQMEDGLGLGVSGTPMVLTADTNHSIEVHTTSPDAAGIHCANRFYHANTVATTGGHWAMWVQNTVGAAGAGHGTMYVKLDCATFEAPTGGNSALNVEMVLPNCTHTGGSYHAFVIDVDAGGPALVMHGNAAIPCAFMKLEVYGTDKAQWETNASLLTLYGCDATEDGLWEASDINDPDFTHTMRINIGGTYYYIGMSSSKAFDA